MFVYNDYELIYMIRDNDDNTALNLMYEKYRPFIYKVLNELNIFHRYYDEFLQEGYMCLNKAIITYDMNYNKTFLKYFELILKRKYYRLFSHYRKIDIPVGDLEDMLEENMVVYNNKAHNLFNAGLEYISNSLEKAIYISVFRDGLSYKDVALKYDINIKKVYNSIQNIKKILNKNIKG